MNNSVDIPVQGFCVTRNGESDVSRMVCTLKGGQADMRFVSARLRRSLHAGAVIRATDMDEFCQAWLGMRGHPLDARSGALMRAKELVGKLSHELSLL